MSLRRSRIAVAAVMSSWLLVGLGVAGSSGAATPDTAAETSVATMPDSAAETSAPSATETADVEILPPDESWGGLSRGELDARSWQWVLSFPEEVIPWGDSTGERCGYGQSGPVFMLVPTENEITCVVAEGTAIWVMVSNVVCPEFGRSEDELRAECSEAIDGITDLQARVNGAEVANLDAYRADSPMFNLTLPENNVFDWEPGVVQAISGGYSFIIAPPPPRQYEIAWTSTPTGEPVPRDLSTVNLVVQAPQVIEPPTT
jgi:hypothetical protein